MNDLVIFILSHGRPENIYTIKSLKKHGYTGQIIVVIDNEDETANEYFEKYENVEIFNKKEIAKTFDEADNFNDRRAIVYARNVCFEIAKKKASNILSKWTMIIPISNIEYTTKKNKSLKIFLIWML